MNAGNAPVHLRTAQHRRLWPLQPVQTPAPSRRELPSTSSARHSNSRALLLRSPLRGLPGAPPAASLKPATPTGSGSGPAGSGGGAGVLTTPTRLVVPYRPTSPGQQLVLVGGCEALGNWDPSKGVFLTWCEGHSHVAEVELPVHTPLQCKLAVLEGARGGAGGGGTGDNIQQATWEPESNRELLLAPSSLAGRAAGYTVFCHWGHPDCTQLLSNSLRRGGTGVATVRSGSAERSGGSGIRSADDYSLRAGVKKALKHATSKAERFAVLPGVASWDEDEGGRETNGALEEEEEEEVVPVQCQVTVLLPRRNLPVGPEQSVVLVGSSAALGYWDPAQGLPLERAGEDSPMWMAQAELPLGEGLQAKIVVVDTVSGEAQVWEPCENRSLPLIKGGPTTRPVMVMITACWGSDSTHCMEVDRLSPRVPATSPQVVTLLRQQLAATSSQLDAVRKTVVANEEQSMERSGGGGGRQEVVQLAEQLATTRRLYEVTKKEAAELGGSVGVTRQLCAGAKRELEGLAAQMEVARQAYEALAPQVERMERQLAATSQAFEATRPELRALEAQLERARSLFDRTLSRIEAAKALSAASSSSSGGQVDSSSGRHRSEASSARMREVQYMKS